MAERRQLEEAHRADLEALGDVLLRYRLAAGLSQMDLAWEAGLGDQYVHSIENARRRTRASTLARLARVLADVEPDLSDPQSLTADFVGAAGGSLAPESDRLERIERRRDRRVRRVRRRPGTRNAFCGPGTPSGYLQGALG